ncbi:MAG TPA: hypothetical protein VHA33_22215 [Candidatus Angelobacter sp.]|jgi:hypothetical protein|nr:hypothetical protein [Candidatus Angelobacter sp.]
MKKLHIFLALTCILLSAMGCIHRQGTNQPVTAFEQVMVWNDALAQTNNHIARGIIDVSPSLIAPEKAIVVLRAQKSIAVIDEQITAILKQGPEAAKLNSAGLQALLNQLSESITTLVNSGVIGIKNPATQQTFDTDIRVVSTLVENILSGLRQAGVVQ